MYKKSMDTHRYKFYALFVIAYMGIGAYNPYIALYLQNTLGFSNQEVASVISIAPLFGVFLIPIWGIFSDLSKRPKTILGIVLIGTFTFVFFMSKVNAFLLFFVVISLMSVFQRAMLPLLDNLAVSYAKESSAKYSFIRSNGSLGFMLGSLITGFLIDRTLPQVFFYVFLVTLFIVTLILFFLPHLRIEHGEKAHLRRDLPMLLKNNIYLKLIIINSILIGVVDTIFPYNGLVIEQISNSTKFVGIVVLFMVLPEIVLMQRVDDLVEKFGPKKILLTAVFFLLIRVVISYFTNNIYVYTVASSFHAVTVAFTIPTILSYVKNVTPSNLSATAITFLMLIVSGFTSLLSFTSGSIMDNFGIKSLFIVMGVAALVGFATISSLKE